MSEERFGRNASSGAPPAPRPRVLIVIANMPLAFDRRVLSECRALLAAGYAVSVICPQARAGEPAKHTLEGISVHSYAAPANGGGLLGYLWEFGVSWLRTARLTRRVNAAQGFDVLQACNPPDTFWLLGALWKLAGKRFVYDQHDLCPEVFQARFGRRGLVHRVLLALEALTYRTADRVISPNPSYQEIATGRGRVPIEHTAVVMSSPDPALMVRGAADPALRKGRRHLVAYVGIMGPQDGLDRLLDMIDTYVHTLRHRDTHFVLLGFGDTLHALRADCTRRGLDPWVTFTGRVDHTELGRWLSTAEVGLTPDPPNEFNHRSTMNKTLEYMAHQVPVLATDLAETRRCAGPAAVYVPGGDPRLAATALEGLLDDPLRRAQMGRLGRARIEGELAWSVQARAYVSVFDDLVGITRLPVRAASNAASATSASPAAVGVPPAAPVALGAPVPSSARVQR